MTPTVRWAVGGAVTAAVILIGAAVWITANSDPTKADPDSRRLVEHGKQVYDKHCSSCHGANLEGQPNWRERLPNGRLPAPPHDATGHTWHHSDKDLFAMVKNGIPEIVPVYQTDMPKYDGILSDRDIWAVLSFIESRWPNDIRERQQRLNKRKP
jgi:mono/diheme cytochrome c family protein